MKRTTISLVFVLVAAGCSDSGGSHAGATTSSPNATQPPATVASTTAEPTSVPPDPFRADRTKMVDFQIEARLIEDPLTIAAMRTVPRHEFVPVTYQDQSYEDHPLPIGHGQTISQPYIVALMTEALGVEPGDRVLEIGTGSGYQAAVLAEMGVEVYTIEIVEELATAAADVLQRLGYEVATLHADGYFGWEEHAPFDAVIVTAAPDHVPQPLIDQLAPGGRLVVPIGPIGAVQTLWRFELDSGGELVGENLGGVFFVPFTRLEE